MRQHELPTSGLHAYRLCYWSFFAPDSRPRTLGLGPEIICTDSGSLLESAFPSARWEAHGHHLTLDTGNVGTRTPVLHIPRTCRDQYVVLCSPTLLAPHP